MRTVLLGAAIALTMAGAGQAQTEAQDAPGPEGMPGMEMMNPGESDPGIEIEEAGPEELGQGAETARPDRAARQAERQRRRQMRRGGMEEPDAFAERRGDRDYGDRARHHGMMMMGRGHADMMGGDGDGSRGAVFRFSRGEGGPTIVIRCAEHDTTQECANAVVPMLEMMFAGQR